MKTRFLYFILAGFLIQFLHIQASGNAPSEKNRTYLGYSDYQIITDTSFRADRYFEMMATHGVNFQRIWVTGYSDVAVKFEELMPFARKGNRYNLGRISPAYKDRLLTVMEQAQAHDQQVMLTLFDHWSIARAFRKTPWYFKNNEERLLKNALPDFYDVRNRKLMRIQENLVREIVRTTRKFDPIYEIMNESAGAKCELLTVWHERVASWIREESHEARIAVNLKSECQDILNAEWVDIISFHQNIWERYGICEAIRKYPEKHVIIDTDGAWEVRDDNRLVKGWLAEASECGASFNHKDDIYEVDRELLKHYREKAQNDTTMVPE